MQLSLDALEAGNATRFINHAKGKAANAEVKRKCLVFGSLVSVLRGTFTDVLVDGDLRLGIYASTFTFIILAIEAQSPCFTERKIKKDEEIYLDYGKKYFDDDSESGDSDANSLTGRPTRLRIVATPAAEHDMAKQ